MNLFFLVRAKKIQSGEEGPDGSGYVDITVDNVERRSPSTPTSDDTAPHDASNTYSDKVCEIYQVLFLTYLL